MRSKQRNVNLFLSAVERRNFRVGVPPAPAPPRAWHTEPAKAWRTAAGSLSTLPTQVGMSYQGQVFPRQEAHDASI